MKHAGIAAGTSIALHGAVLLLFARGPAPKEVTSPGPREKAVQVEVMRLAGLVPLLDAPVLRVGQPARAPEPIPTAVRPQRDLTTKLNDAAHPERSRATGESSGAAHPENSRATEESRGAAHQPSRATEQSSGAAHPGATEESSGPVDPEPSGASGEPGGAAHSERNRATGDDAKSGDGAPIDTSALSARLQQVALRCYPAAARRFRQTGEAQLRFCLDNSGGLKETTVVRSTGSELLDHAASDCVVPGAAPFGPETFGRCFTVPVRFKP